MPLIKSISGIRGTVGGRIEENLTPIDVVKFIAAFGTCLKEKDLKPRVVLARDARPSGSFYLDLAAGTLNSLGIDVVDAGAITTPTMQMAVIMEKAQAGIILSASHNPNGWNALKMVDHNGEFLTKEIGKKILAIVDKDDYEFVLEDKIGKREEDNTFLEKHIDKILELDLVDQEAIAKADFSIAIDGVNSVGGPAIARLLERLGVRMIKKINCDNSGIFPHDPEPLDKNLTQLSETVQENGCDVGLVTDPDGDRLSLVCEDGSFFNEEYVIVAAADHVLGKVGGGNTVSNLSSSSALKEIAQKHNGKHSYSAVGEINVVLKMKESGAVIGGEGSGGVIYPELHYGRDSLVGVALFLSFLAENGLKVSELKKKYPAYFISKNKVELGQDMDLKKALEDFKNKYKDEKITDIDGVRVDFYKEWVHLRASNTEPIIRIYAESSSPEKADELAQKVINEIKHANLRIEC
ncbi:phosphoglucosamine mutase [Candidatus Falkowbacteria bacterium]|nr:phosphoglucosamine mutase [Candidatus Falkowbacteria bacterium]